ncbi:MAG TPA: hypothetical protein VFR85_00725 [Anaeromyxobacteraceae bacterium]|nr:hypothetical protein [Anaeromyxobacteraceae bacterium]
MSNVASHALPWHRREDTWAIAIAIALVLAATAAHFLGAAHLVGATAPSFPTWSGGVANATAVLGSTPAALLLLFGAFLAAFSIASPMVDHLTRVYLEPAPAPTARCDAPVTAADVRAEGDRVRAHAERVARMMDILAARGFRFRRAGRRIVAESVETEASEVKDGLLAAGFVHCEFQIVLEYGRRWGIL